MLVTAALGFYSLFTGGFGMTAVTVVGLGWLLAATSEALTAGVAHPARHRFGCMLSVVVAVVLTWQWWQLVEAVAEVPQRAWLLWTPLPLAMMTHLLGVVVSRRLSVPSSDAITPRGEDDAAATV